MSNPTLNKDEIKYLSSYLNPQDIVSLSHVDETYKKALAEDTRQIWENEWKMYKENYKNKSWFTETVRTEPIKDSQWNSFSNLMRSVMGKQEKQIQSWRQWWAEKNPDDLIVKNPSPEQLLLANEQRRIKSEGTSESYEKMLTYRPKFAVAAHKLKGVVLAPLLFCVGISLIPVTLCTATGIAAYRRKKGQSVKFEDLYIYAAPTSLPIILAASLCSDIAEPNLRELKHVLREYKNYKEELEKSTSNQPNDLEEYKLCYY